MQTARTSVHRIGAAVSGLPLARAAKRHIRMAVAVSKNRMAYPPGHFYSPVPSLDEVRANASIIFGKPSTVPGIDLQVERQLACLQDLATYYPTQPFEYEKSEALRYYFNNSYFGYGDGLVLHTMLRHLRPHNIIEVGSGYSSALMLDTIEHFLNGQTHCTFIEPYPERRLSSLLRPGDAKLHRVISTRLQEVDPGLFDQLGSGDILFIDSSHVSKVGSDVNMLFGDIIPNLAPGVVVHVHDIRYPFEYPEEWVYEGRCWNEAYMVRAFLAFNAQFRIVFFNSYMSEFHTAAMKQAMPLSLRKPGGSLWFERFV